MKWSYLNLTTSRKVDLYYVTDQFVLTAGQIGPALASLKNYKKTT